MVRTQSLARGLVIGVLIASAQAGCSAASKETDPPLSSPDSSAPDATADGGITEAAPPADASGARPVDALVGAYAFAVGHVYDPNNAFVNTIMNDPSIDGIFIGVPWSKVAPSSTTTDFAAIDAWLDAAAAAGKKVSIGIEAGSATPSWVGSADDYLTFTVYNFQQKNCNADLKVPIPWHATYLAAMKDLIDAFAKHLRSNTKRYATVSAIKMTGINNNTFETSLPNEAAATHGACTTTDAAAAWQSIGYTAALVEGAWQAIIGYWGSAFPLCQCA